MRKSVGWNEIENRQALAGLEGSAFLISAVAEDKPVSLARVIMVGHIALISDVIVSPEYQGNGIAKAMLQEIMNYLNNSIEDGQCLFIYLMSVKDKEPFYRQFGFEDRPNENYGAGMSQRIYRD